MRVKLGQVLNGEIVYLDAGTDEPETSRNPN